MICPRMQALAILDGEEQVHVPRVLVYDHKASGVAREAIHASLVEGRDVWWQDVIGDQPTECEVEWVGAEDPLFKVGWDGWVGWRERAGGRAGGQEAGEPSLRQACI